VSREQLEQHSTHLFFDALEVPVFFDFAGLDGVGSEPGTAPALSLTRREGVFAMYAAFCDGLRLEEGRCNKYKLIAG
jgi:hypothetical protein